MVAPHNENTPLDSESTASPLKREAYVVRRSRAGLIMAVMLCGFTGAMMGLGLLHQGRTCSMRSVTTAPPGNIGCSDGCTWLGVEMRNTRRGVQIVRIFPGTPAADLARSGLLEPGDIIEQVGGARVNRAAQVIQSIRSRAPGDIVGMRLVRHGGQAMVMLEAELGWISGQQFNRLR